MCYIQRGRMRDVLFCAFFFFFSLFDFLHFLLLSIAILQQPHHSIPLTLCFVCDSDYAKYDENYPLARALAYDVRVVFILLFVRASLCHVPDDREQLILLVLYAPPQCWCTIFPIAPFVISIAKWQNIVRAQSPFFSVSFRFGLFVRRDLNIVLSIVLCVREHAIACGSMHLIKFIWENY